MILCRETHRHVQSHRKFALAEPQAGAGRARAADPRQLVLWGALAFCLSVWAIVILAVTHYV